MKTSLVITLLNEEETIGLLLESIKNQSQLPDEIVIVDGGSTDATVRLIRQFITDNKLLGRQFKLLHKPGNRSVGRNYGVEHTSHEIILFTDSGCMLDKDWTKEISEPFSKNDTDVVAGFYEGFATGGFQKALVPYVLVMPDQVNPKSFLPATRSMAIRKTVFDELGGFDEKLAHNEDYAFAKEIEKQQKKIVFIKKAIVFWIPRNTVRQAFTMFARFAYGDIQAKIIRPKVLIIFVRYFLVLGLICAILFNHSVVALGVLIVYFCLYIFWSIYKNYKYVKTPSAFFYLPVLQFLSDGAVIYGSTKAFFRLPF